MLTWLMSAITIYIVYAAGNKWAYAWALGMLNQFLWGYFAISRGEYGLLPTCAVLLVIYSRNLWKWRG